MEKDYTRREKKVYGSQRRKLDIDKRLAPSEIKYIGGGGCTEEGDDIDCSRV